MKENTDATMSDNSASDSVSKISLALRELKPNQRCRKEKEFAEHYEEIAALIKSGVTVKDVRDALAKGGLSMSAATFKKMLNSAEAKRLEAAGEMAPSAGGAK
jgi:ATP-dependent exoDNAse (exonuclease V) beta subunit